MIMGLQDTIVRCLRNYPSLYATRADVLHTMFVVGGAGYCWEDGALVNIYDDGDRPVEDVFETPFVSVLNKPSDSPDTLEYKRIERLREELRVKRTNVLIAFTRDNAHALAQIPCGVGHGDTHTLNEFAYMSRSDIYPLSDSANLMTIPDDADAEHVDAAREVIMMIYGHTPSPEEKTRFKTTILLADKALASIQKRFGKRENDIVGYADYQERRRRMMTNMHTVMSEALANLDEDE